MIKRTFKTESEVVFNSIDEIRYIAVKIIDEGYLQIQMKVNGGWQVVDSVYYSGAYKIHTETSLIKFIPVTTTGTVYYSLPLGINELRTGDYE